MNCISTSFRKKLILSPIAKKLKGRTFIKTAFPKKHPGYIFLVNILKTSLVVDVAFYVKQVLIFLTKIDQKIKNTSLTITSRFANIYEPVTFLQLAI